MPPQASCETAVISSWFEMLWNLDIIQKHTNYTSLQVHKNQNQFSKNKTPSQYRIQGKCNSINTLQVHISQNKKISFVVSEHSQHAEVFCFSSRHSWRAQGHFVANTWLPVGNPTFWEHQWLRKIKMKGQVLQIPVLSSIRRILLVR